jgi:hypothetical protein
LGRNAADDLLRGGGDARLHRRELIGDNRDVVGGEREPRAACGDAVQALGHRRRVTVRTGIDARRYPGEVCPPPRAFEWGRSFNDPRVGVGNGDENIIDGAGRDRLTHQFTIEQQLHADVRARERAAAGDTGIDEIALYVSFEVDEPRVPVEHRVGSVVQLDAVSERSVGGREVQTGHRREIGQCSTEEELGVARPRAD